MYINSYKYIFSNHSELPDPVNNSFDQIQAIENIKESLKRSAEEFEIKKLLKKTKLVASTDARNLSYVTDILTNDISCVEQVKNSSSSTNEVSEIIEKKIESLHARKSSIEEDPFQKIIEELCECPPINKEMILANEIPDLILLSSAVDSEIYLQSGSFLTNSTKELKKDIILAAKMSEAKKGRQLTQETRQKISEARKGRQLTQEARQKMSEAKKGRQLTQETRQKMSEAKKGRQLTQETKQKISEARKGRQLTQEARQKMSEARKGKHHTQETRQKMSEARKGRQLTQETRQKISEARKGRQLTQEARQKMSEARKGRQLTQETRQKISEARKGRQLTQEARQKMSEARKGRQLTQETRQKMSEARKGRQLTQETKQKLFTQEARQKISEAKKGKHHTQETRQKISEAKKGKHHTQETRQKMSEARKLIYRNPEIIELSRQRTDEAIDSILAKTYDHIKVEPEEELLPKGDYELQMIGSSKRIHEINNSLPILQDPNDPTHSLFYEVEGSIDQIKISRYGELELSSSQKKQMLEEVKEWIEMNENNRELYQQKLDELSELSIPIEIGPDRGRSVYAKRNIRKFEVIGPYAGILQRSEEELNHSIHKKGSYPVLSYLFNTRSKNRSIDAFGTGNTLSLINTGQLPGKPIWNENNLAIIQVGKNLNFYVAKRDISQEEELLVDYGPNYNPMYFFKAEKED